MHTKAERIAPACSLHMCPLELGRVSRPAVQLVRHALNLIAMVCHKHDRHSRDLPNATLEVLVIRSDNIAAVLLDTLTDAVISVGTLV